METILIKNKASKRFKKKDPLIRRDDLLLDSDYTSDYQWAKFLNEKKEFLGYGYLGKQNKGFGWMISFDESQPITNEYIGTLFEKAFKKRGYLFNDEKTTAFRLFNGEGDGLGGITIDWYNAYLVISWYNESIYSHRQLIVELLKNKLTNLVGIYEKVRFQNHELPISQLIYGNQAAEPLFIKENGVVYATYLNDGLMTGIFLDQKEVRGALINGLADKKTVLNAFSYTGAFSVASLIGGAKETTSVDLAKRSIEKTREQFTCNDIDPDTQQIIVMDVFNYFKYAKKRQFNYDLIILDPPSFARNKKKTFSVAKDYRHLTKEAVELINPNGILIASTNAANVSIEKFKRMIQEGIKDAKRRGELIQIYRLPRDFSVSNSFFESNYLKVLIYELD